VAARCAANGVEVIDTRGLVHDAAGELGADRVYAANGCDLRRPGHEPVGKALASWIEADLDAKRPSR
jgi:hypothetical protein